MEGTVNKLPVYITLDSTAAAQNVLPQYVALSEAESLLGSAVINGKATGATTLFTVPAGKRCIPTKALLVMTSASNVTGVADVGIGDSATFDNIVSSTTLTNFDATGESWRFDIAANLVAAANNPAAAQAIKIEVDTAATTTGASDTYTFSVYLFGHLV